MARQDREGIGAGRLAFSVLVLFLFVISWLVFILRQIGIPYSDARFATAILPYEIAGSAEGAPGTAAASFLVSMATAAVVIAWAFAGLYRGRHIAENERAYP